VISNTNSCRRHRRARDVHNKGLNFKDRGFEPSLLSEGMGACYSKGSSRIDDEEISGVRLLCCSTNRFLLSPVSWKGRQRRR
jgi:hypothetical protein